MIRVCWAEAVPLLKKIIKFHGAIHYMLQPSSPALDAMKLCNSSCLSSWRAPFFKSCSPLLLYKRSARMLHWTIREAAYPPPVTLLKLLPAHCDSVGRLLYCTELSEYSVRHNTCVCSRGKCFLRVKSLNHSEITGPSTADQLVLLIILLVEQLFDSVWKTAHGKPVSWEEQASQRNSFHT